MPPLSSIPNYLFLLEIFGIWIDGILYAVIKCSLYRAVAKLKRNDMYGVSTLETFWRTWFILRGNG